MLFYLISVHMNSEKTKNSCFQLSDVALCFNVINSTIIACMPECMLSSVSWFIILTWGRSVVRLVNPDIHACCTACV